MKKLIKSLFLVSVLATSSAMVFSCDKDDEATVIPNKEVKVSDVKGSYTGKWNISQGNNKAEYTLAFSADTAKFTFDDFPVKEIVKSIVNDDAKTTAALTAMGKIKYELPYTAALDSTKKIVNVTFAPRTLALNIPVDNATKKAEVTITATQKGAYTSAAASTLNFQFEVSKISVDSTDLSGFTAIKYAVQNAVKK